MFAQLRRPRPFAKAGISAASAAILLLGLCSCQTAGDLDVTGALGDKAPVSHASDPRRDLDTYRERFRANPGDVDAALEYAKALRATGQKAQAVAVLEKATLTSPATRRCSAVTAGRSPTTAISSRPSTC